MEKGRRGQKAAAREAGATRREASSLATRSTSGGVIFFSGGLAIKMPGSGQGARARVFERGGDGELKKYKISVFVPLYV